MDPGDTDRESADTTAREVSSTTAVETASRARRSVTTYSRKRNFVAPPSVLEDHATAKRTLVEPPAWCTTAEVKGTVKCI